MNTGRKEFFLSEKGWSVVFLIIVSAGYALLSVAIRILATVFGPLTQVYIRVGLGAIAGIIIFRRKVRWKRIFLAPLSDWMSLMVMGVVGYALMVYFITIGALNAKLVNVSVVYATTSLFTYFYSVALLKKGFSWMVLGYILMSLVGVGMIATKAYVPVLRNFGRGEWFVLLSAACGAWYYVGRKMLSDFFNNSEISVLVMIIAFISSFVMAGIAGEKLVISGRLAWELLLGLVIGGGFNIVTIFLENYAFKHLDAVVGSQILLADNIFALLFGFLIYGERMGLPEMVGAVVVILAVYQINAKSG